MRGDDGQQREQAGKGLHPENRALGSEASEDAGDDHTAEEEKLDRIRAVAAVDAPQQTRGEKAVVQALIRSKTGGRLGEFGREAEGAQSERLGPEEHLQDQKAEVQH